MAEASDKQTPDVVQVWRDWLTQSERQVNAFFAETMGRDNSAQAISGVMELYAMIQRLLAEGMQRYLTFVNMPSRNDVTGLGETLRRIEDRLARIEETLQIAAEAIDAGERAASPFEPPRTRQAPAFENGETPFGAQTPPPFAPAQPQPAPSSIPEELRR